MVKFLSLLFLLVACTSKEEKAWQEYKEYLRLRKFSEAEKVLHSKEIKNQEKNRLLFLMESGALSYYQGRYKEASQTFLEAIEYVDQLYTTSATEKVGKYIISDASEAFKGAAFERSWLYYFGAMSFLKLYFTQENFKDKTPLFQARALMVAWDSFFQEHQRAQENKTIYQHDLISKLLAGHIHELIDTGSDRQIAKQLYKDALIWLESWGGGYQIFNTQAGDYLKQVKSAVYKGKAPKTLSKSETDDFARLKTYLQEKIKLLEKNQTSFKTVLFLEEGLIPEKKAEMIPLGLKGLVQGIEDPQTKKVVLDIGAGVLTYFAVETLGLVPKHLNASHINRFYFARDLTEVTVREAAIELEVPRLDHLKPLMTYELEVIQKDRTEKINLTKVVDLAEQSQLVLDEESGLRLVRVGTRVAIKYIAAIASAYSVYSSLESKDNNFLAQTAAMGTFLAATKVLKDRADLRAWQSLPRAIYFTPLGGYQKIEELSLHYKESAGKILTLSQAVDLDRPAILSYSHLY